jgi:hypothetical protein
MTMLMLGRILYIDLCRPKPLPLDLTRNQAAIGQAQGADDRAEGLDLHARIDQSAKRHIAADAASTVEVGNFSHVRNCDETAVY